MKVLKVEWKNFNSYGNVVQEVSFKEPQGDLIILLGKNGDGKTTISEVITYGLYGKVEKKNKKDLVNRINKNLWVRITLQCKSKIVEIERGISPGLFNVIIDGEPYDTAGNLNVQDYLELEIFDIPYQVFKNILVLSVNDFRSFLTMSPGDKRNIVDKLFGFSIINEMRESIKNERKIVKSSLKTYEDELGIIEESIISIGRKIEESKEQNSLDRKKYLDQLKVDINQAKADLTEVSESLESTLSQRSKLEQSLIEFRRKKNRKTENKKHLEKKLDLYENGQCPHCESDLTDADSVKFKMTLDESKNLLIKELEEAAKDIERSEQSFSSISKVKIELEGRRYKLESKIDAKIKEAKTLLSAENDKESDLLEIKREQIQKKSDRKKNINKQLNEEGFLSFMDTVLGEDGIKNLATKTILPNLNHNISQMSMKMHLPYAIKFDDKFNCVISALGEEISAKSMSTGERKKADFIVIIALLKILKVRYPNLNIMFLDEIFSSVDMSGVYEIIKILSEVSKENKINTWVINHSELPLELFDKKVEAVKEGAFSKIKMETIS